MLVRQKSWMVLARGDFEGGNLLVHGWDQPYLVDLGLGIFMVMFMLE